MSHRLLTLLGLIAAAPFLMVVRLIRPFILVRFGGLLSYRIGHFVANTELYLSRREFSGGDKRSLDIFFHQLPICNFQLKTMWDRKLHVSGLVKHLDRLNRMIPGGDRHVVPISKARDTHGVLAKSSAHLSFTQEEEERGTVALARLGVPAGTPFVCFHSRDSAYLDAKIPAMDWAYHDYRDSDIQSYVPAALEIVKRGNYAVRIGAIVEQPLDTSDTGIIDYAAANRSDFMDIYLNAKCRFLLCDGAGIASVAVVFRRPVAFVNFIPMEFVCTWNPKAVFIPKKLWNLRESRYLKFREILDSGVGRFLHTEQYQESGIEVVDNSPQEITDVALEMDDRLNGLWETTEEDELLQRRFWSHFPSSELNGVFLSRIGAKFLRENRELLN